MGSANVDPIKKIRDGAGTDAEALAQIFSASTLTDDGTIPGRLRAILAATESSIVPGLQTGIDFHDTGFAADFKDPWPSSDNQVGHFLTAVGLSFNPGKVTATVAGKSLRSWLGAPSAMSDEEVAIRLCVGHEKSADPSKGLAVAAFVVDPFLAPMYILTAFAEQFAAATAMDVAVFRRAVANLGAGRPLDKASAKSTIRSIAVTATSRGNSYEDLLLSVYGWRLGQDIKAGRPPSNSDNSDWVRKNLM
jgi:hypothetical protein